MLVALETAVVVLLVVLVAGLLRSHADILRALHSLGARVGDPTAAAPAGAPLPAGAPGVADSRLSGPAGRRAAGLLGTTPDGETVGISVGGGDILVAFLSSGCGTCAGFWQALADGRAGALLPARVVAVTRDPAEESRSALASLLPPGGEVAVVMSSRAWDDYLVPGSPYFVYVDGEGRVSGEGTARHWDQLLSLCMQARADAGDREARADRELLAAGIHPGHPSLYPDRLG